MTEISIKEMLDAGAHFGHQTKRWNPKMKPYIYGARSGIHIIDLQQTQSLAMKALKTVEDIVSQGQQVLFVGTKKQAQEVIEEQAKRCSMPFITRRWLGGMLTNFPTIRKSVEKLIELEMRREKNDFTGYTKKELLNIDRQIEKFEKALGGIKNLKRLPGALFIVDTQIERIAVHEANLLGIPVIAIADSNCDPDPIDYPIPANDDALRCIQIFASKVADSCLIGVERKQALALKEAEEAMNAEPKKKASRTSKNIQGSGKAYVTQTDSYKDKEGEDIGSFSASVAVEEESLKLGDVEQKDLKVEGTAEDTEEKIEN